MASAASFQTNEAIIDRCVTRVYAVLANDDDDATGPRVASAICLMGRDLAVNSLTPLPEAPEVTDAKRKAWAPVIDALQQVRDACEAARLSCDESAPTDPRQAADWALSVVTQAYTVPRDAFRQGQRPLGWLRLMPPIPDSKIVAFDRKLESLDGARRSISATLDEARPVSGEKPRASRRMTMA